MKVWDLTVGPYLFLGTEPIVQNAYFLDKEGNLAMLSKYKSGWLYFHDNKFT